MTDRHAATRELTELLKRCQCDGTDGFVDYDKRWRPIPCRVCQPKQPQALTHPEQQAVGP